jgi:hypothetical protein
MGLPGCLNEQCQLETPQFARLFICKKREGKRNVFSMSPINFSSPFNIASSELTVWLLHGFPRLMPERQIPCS